jgi:hypothetical protein
MTNFKIDIANNTPIHEKENPRDFMSWNDYWQNNLLTGNQNPFGYLMPIVPSW